MEEGGKKRGVLLNSIGKDEQGQREASRKEGEEKISTDLENRHPAFIPRGGASGEKAAELHLLMKEHPLMVAQKKEEDARLQSQRYLRRQVSRLLLLDLSRIA